ncbi:conjugal transfer protein [Bacteroidia bacterium]|nr:conjugal transfer protein [Bacteroidia bacterium]GHT63644.1 conjugal transfer protein [Bacteroidia bacterium]
MKRFAAYFLYTLLLAAVACACSDNLSVRMDYEFTVAHLPVPKRLKVGEVAEIRCNLVRSGYYEGARYCVRYYQPDGKGELWMENGKPFLPNDIYPVTSDNFRLYYRSLSEDQQTIDLVFSDNFGNTQELSFSFSNEKEQKVE